jgi:hypothetical protein
MLLQQTNVCCSRLLQSQRPISVMQNEFATFLGGLETIRCTPHPSPRHHGDRPGWADITVTHRIARFSGSDLSEPPNTNSIDTSCIYLYIHIYIYYILQVSAFSTTIAANTQVTRYEPYTASLYILTKSITLVPAPFELYDKRSAHYSHRRALSMFVELYATQNQSGLYSSHLLRSTPRCPMPLKKIGPTRGKIRKQNLVP